MDLLFIGDSLTRGWPRTIWSREFARYGALNLGFHGDRSSSLIWRLQQGQWGEGSSALHPKLVVLLVGTNDLGNLGRGSKPEELAAGVVRILEFVRQRSPGSRTLLVGVLPRRAPNAMLEERRTRTNALIAGCADGENVTFLDASKALAPNGQPDASLYRDNVHLTEEGYERLQAALSPVIRSLMARPSLR
ncbi:GDSL-like protein [Acetobacteraceae bacterium AT-5844]|nr:GDSL-like protein [Acetobacteraceae bacterium AT-5844]